MNTAYKILFWLARSISVFTVGVLLFTILNAKYMLSEIFFQLSLKLVLNYQYW